MLHAITLFRALGIIEPIQSADQVTSDPAYALEVNAFPYKRVHRASFAHGLYLKLGGSCFFFLLRPVGRQAMIVFPEENGVDDLSRPFPDAIPFPPHGPAGERLISVGALGRKENGASHRGQKLVRRHENLMQVMAYGLQQHLRLRHLVFRHDGFDLFRRGSGIQKVFVTLPLACKVSRG